MKHEDTKWGGGGRARVDARPHPPEKFKTFLQLISPYGGGPFSP